VITITYHKKRLWRDRVRRA